jgi:glutaredoxin
MFATRRLLFSTRITFFTRETCGLCSQAKHVLSDVWDKRPFDYTEVNVDLPKPESKQWRDIYDFDVPVVSRTTNLEFSRIHMKF